MYFLLFLHFTVNRHPTLWFLKTVIHDLSRALCACQALVQKGKRSLALSEGNNDMCNVPLYKLNIQSPTKLPYYRRIHLKPCRNRLLCFTERKIKDAGSALRGHVYKYLPYLRTSFRVTTVRYEVAYITLCCMCRAFYHEFKLKPTNAQDY
jgi:hypothetical protein